MPAGAASFWSRSTPQSPLVDLEASFSFAPRENLLVSDQSGFDPAVWSRQVPRGAGSSSTCAARFFSPPFTNSGLLVLRPPSPSCLSTSAGDAPGQGSRGPRGRWLGSRTLSAGANSPSPYSSPSEALASPGPGERRLSFFSQQTPFLFSAISFPCPLLSIIAKARRTS